MLSSIVRLLRFASFVICTIVIASFVIFAVTETKSASSHQTEEIAGHQSATTSTSPGAAGSRERSKAHVGSLHRTIDEASEQLTSPFAGIASRSTSEWASRGVKLALALAVYGFGLGYLARVLRIRV